MSQEGKIVLRKNTPRPSSILSEDLNLFVKELREQYANISLETMCSMCIDIMQKVERFKKLKGPQRKEIVLFVIYKLIEHVDENLYEQYELIIEKTLRSMIDIVVDIDKNRTKIRKGIGIISMLCRTLGVCT